ncbi:hypothetical protein V6N12_003896 [Hibiscus sabdariffa]|uniref:Reverse transcriptase zinc-binding domain-containing protein n=1 Tax=Hibiscus sabdariffa TaxID=183260 RepID=A0ABR2CJX2_9ROSI
MASGKLSEYSNDYPSVEGFVGDGLEGAAGGRPPDTSTNGGGGNVLEKDVEMSDNIDTGKRTGYPELAIVGETETDQSTMRLQGSGSQMPSFKEKLIGKSGAERVSETRKPDDLYGPWMQVTNRRRRNANVQGVGGRISGASRTKEIMGSRFQLLASDSMDGVEEIPEQQQVGDVRGSRNELREEGLASRDRGQGNQDNNGSVEVVRRRGPVESRISLGVVNETGTSSANKSASKEVNVGRVETGGVVNAVAALEKVTMAKSNLNSEKHRAVLVGNTDESHIPRLTKGRVLPNSMRGLTVKPGSRFQLGVKGGASTSMAVKKVAERGLSKDNRLAFSCTLLSSPRPTRVADMVTNDGLWDWDRIGSSLPRIALDRIASVPPPRAGLGGDFPVWRWEDKRVFTTRSAYAFLALDPGTHYPAVWKRIWKLIVPQRVLVFVWVTLHERLLTNAERVRRHFANSDLCGICGGAKEDLEHVLRSCAIAKGLWLRLIPSGARVSFFSLTFKEWFCKNLFDRTFVTTDDEWPHRFAIMCWLLWKRRCRLLLEEDVGVLDDVLVTGNCLLMQTKDAFTMLVGSNARNAVARTWCRPQPGWRGRELGAGSSAFYLPPEGTTALVIQEQGASGAVPGMHARGAPVISGAAVGIG